VLVMRGLLAALTGLLAVAGCGDNLAPSFLDDTTGELPATIGELGLYADPADRDSVSDRVHAYEPLQPLWSNGSTKARYLFAPAPITVAATGAWTFPAGTVLFKTFSYPDGPLETRVLRATDDGWDYADYRWRDDGSDGDLLDLAEPVPVGVELDGAAFDHVIPGRLDCRSCHESAGSPVLGFDELGLGPLQLGRFIDDGVITGELSSEPDTVTGRTPRERDVLVYLEGNCTHCHNGGTGPSSAFDLRHPDAIDAMICRPTTGQTAEGYRIVPGDPASSILFLAVSGEGEDPDIKPMPPLGVQHRDAEAIELLRAWIEELEGKCDE
jgi:hypothetical protein